MQRTLAIELRGAVNGIHVEAAGDGSIDLEEGRIDASLRFDSTPFDWDPGFVVPIYFDCLALVEIDFDSTEVDPPPLLIRAHQSLTDEFGREIGESTLQAVASSQAGAGLLRVQIVRACSRLELDEETVAVEEAGQLLVPSLTSESTVVTSAWTFRTRRGNRYRSISTTHAPAASTRGGPDVGTGAALRGLEVAALERERGRSGTELRLRARILPRPVT